MNIFFIGQRQYYGNLVEWKLYVNNCGWSYNKSGRWTDKLAKAKLYKSIGVCRAALTNLIKLNPGESYDILSYEVTNCTILQGEQAAAQERIADKGREKLVRQRSAKAVELAEKKRQLEKLQKEIDSLS